MNSKVLVTREMTEKHTSTHIAESLTEIAKNWNLNETVVAIVHDNASNIVLTSNLLISLKTGVTYLVLDTHFNLQLMLG